MSRRTLLDPDAEAQFRQARRRAFWNRVIHFLQGRPQQLLSFDEVRDKLHVGSQSYAGMMTVEVEKIVGSVGRYRDFDRAFLPLQSHTSDRWKEIAEAYHEGRFLPPVKLYKVGAGSTEGADFDEGAVYFVRDGHHRVSVAREQGAKYIDAEVIECRTRVSITPDVTEEELDLKAEYAEFLEATNLDRLRPEQEIECTISGAYQILLEHIAVHRYFLGLERGEAIPWQEAVLSWYDNLYRPIVEIIRQQSILVEFPGRREADLYLWIIEHHYYLQEEGADRKHPADGKHPEVDFTEAAEDFAEEYSQRPVKKVLRSVRHLLEEMVEETPLITDIETQASEPGLLGGEEGGG